LAGEVILPARKELMMVAKDRAAVDTLAFRRRLTATYLLIQHDEAPIALH
jgi:hypothetical protein